MSYARGMASISGSASVRTRIGRLSTLQFSETFSHWQLQMTFKDTLRAQPFSQKHCRKKLARGAEVWDRLVSIERGNLHDAELLTQARAFKEEYIERVQSGKATRDVNRAWAEWKAKHYTKSTGARGRRLDKRNR